MAENYEKLINIQKSFITGNVKNLVEKSRWFVREGNLTKVSINININVIIMIKIKIKLNKIINFDKNKGVQKNTKEEMVFLVFRYSYLCKCGHSKQWWQFVFISQNAPTH